MSEDLTLIGAWDKLQEINNNIELLETLLESKLSIGASKLKEILVKCSFTSNDQFINSLISKDESVQNLSNLYHKKSNYENYIRKEIKRIKITDEALCIMFLKDYYRDDNNKKMTWEDIAKEMGYSIRQCKRYYYEYKGYTPENNSYFNEKIKMARNGTQKR